MSTFLFDKIIFGPVKSRRLGVSLGVNLLPTDQKICSFDCIYCECGWNKSPEGKKPLLPSRKHVKDELETKLKQMVTENLLPDVITFAGNGEPTLHPEFEGIIDDTIELRNKLTPKARIAVLSNSSMLHKLSVKNALLKVDDNILKLDSGFEETIKKLDCPSVGFKLDNLIKNLMWFEGNLIIQTLFVKGVFKNETIDNTSKVEIEQWLELIKEIKPQQVMIYTIDRATPAVGLEKIAASKLKEIATLVEEIGIKTQVSG